LTAERGPRKRLATSELVEMGIASLAESYDISRDSIRKGVVASRAINWGNDPFARGAYSSEARAGRSGIGADLPLLRRRMNAEKCPSRDLGGGIGNRLSWVASRRSSSVIGYGLC
jgi:hypothetical protein